ncbi:MAG: flagellar hook-associated protein FlgK [Proteobacteria bacterium]|nr:flagellar hook-associated protein FlgK [Pseudomonadota bacterium]
MGITSALNNANSGLSASARAVQVVSANIANALTPGYAARQLELSAATLGGAGGGVRVTGVTRLVDPILLGLQRDAGASLASGNSAAAFWQRIEASLGQPGEGLSAALSAFDAALIGASERPDLTSRLAAVAESAKALATKLGSIEETVQQLRVEADKAIAQDVRTLNEGIARVDVLNDQIVKLRMSGQPTEGLEDERQALISALSEIVPLREYPRDTGRVMLYSAAGELLLDTEPTVFGFSPSVAIDAGMTLGAGLSGLTINGRPLATGDSGPIGGGRLSAAFALRDEAAPGVQTRIDAFARDLIARFSDPDSDPTLAGAVGLFTDGGGPDSGPPGLAARLTLNAAVDPAAGGALWRIRDGIGAAAPGPIGDPAQINRLLGALDRSLSSGAGSPLQDSAALLGDLLTGVSRNRQVAEDRQTSARTRHDTLTEAILAQGVDTDSEMQRLLLIEEAYAANARVIQTADAMLRTLLEI